MSIGRRWVFSLVLVSVLLLCAPSASFAGIRGRIVEGVGIKTAKLGLHDSTDAARIGGPYKRAKDTNYPGQVVWRYRFGSKMSNGKYPVEMYSHGNHHVFNFVINAKALVTSNGTHVGTSESDLTSRYGSRITRSVGPRYTDYYMGTRSGRTDFFVRDGVIHHIVISRY